MMSMACGKVGPAKGEPFTAVKIVCPILNAQMPSAPAMYKYPSHWSALRTDGFVPAAYGEFVKGEIVPLLATLKAARLCDARLMAKTLPLPKAERAELKNVIAPGD